MPKQNRNTNFSASATSSRKSAILRYSTAILHRVLRVARSITKAVRYRRLARPSQGECPMKIDIGRISWCVSVTCLISSLVFPSTVPAIWFAGAAILLPILWISLREPVNYESLRFNADGFRFVAGPTRAYSMKWEDIKDVYYCRSFCDFTNHIETEWQFHGKNGEVAIVLVEWTHRKPFANAVATYVRGVSAEEVQKVLRFKSEGRWKCSIP